MNLKVNVSGLRLAENQYGSLNVCRGLPIVFLKRHRGADRLEHLCAVPFGEFT